MLTFYFIDVKYNRYTLFVILGNKKMKKILLLILTLIIFLASCESLEVQKYYNKIQVYENNGKSYYVVNNEKSGELIIYLEGSGLSSVLGTKVNNFWTSIHLSFFIIKHYSEHYNILIPEKLTMVMGEEYKNNKDILSSYTVKNIGYTYSQSIDHYLENTNYSSIYIIGSSEGGLLLPFVYNNLENKNRIKKLVIIGSGGLSQYECFKILGTSKMQMPQEYREQCLKIDSIKKDIEMYPNSIDKGYFGWPYKRWSSFFEYRPINELININIPILFIQGVLDWNSPVESVKYIEEFEISNNYTFLYYEDMGHGPEQEQDIFSMLDEINNWIQD